MRQERVTEYANRKELESHELRLELTVLKQEIESVIFSMDELADELHEVSNEIRLRSDINRLQVLLK